MGAGASQGFVEAADDKVMEMPDAPEHLKALASRLSKAHGVSEAIVCQGLVVLEPCVQRGSSAQQGAEGPALPAAFVR